MVKEELPFFPDPYPDEDFRSILKRYHIRSGNKYEYLTRQEILGSSTNNILPRNLHYLLERLPDYYKKEKLIFENTHLPLIWPFLSNKRKNEAMEDIYFIQDSKHSASVLLKDLVSQDLRYCTKCKEEDLNKYGEVYARRIHQLKNFDYCNRHNLSLENADGTPYALIKTRERELLTPVFNEIKKTLDNRLYSIHVNYLWYKYMAHFFNREYIAKNGKLITQRFLSDFLIYHDGLLVLLGINERYLQTKNRFLKTINFKANKPNPILHILMMLFFESSVERFLTERLPNIASIIPFGTGPWFCCNHLCPHYNSPVITTCKRNIRKKGDPTGTFKCSHCGYTYRKNTKNKVNEYRVVTFGELWERELVLKYKQTFSLEKTADYCHVKVPIARSYLLRLSPDYKMKKSKNFFEQEQIEEMINVYKETRSIRKTAEILGVDRKTLNKYIPQELVNNTSYYYKSEEEKKIKYKQKVLEFMQRSRNPMRSDIRHSVGEEVYKFLMKEERDWMEKNLPSRYSIQRDWNELDKKISVEVLDCIQKLKEDLPNRKITKNRIKDSLPISSSNLINNNPDKLAATLEIIRDSVE
ncbi:TnsD family Tn7-like transposition protein [Oceanobacillus kapialis]|uniref:TnsD family Tn7-like transposition protein n=1 Tax=Oceanobacillus kapialis TaxID=481353 RepID=UPI00384F9227